MVKVRDVIAAVEEAGWVYVRTKGDHRQYTRPGQPGIVTIAGKLNVDMPEGTLNAVCKDAGINKVDLKRGKIMSVGQYKIIYEEGPTSWGAHVENLPGCIAVASTREECERLIAEAIDLHVDALRRQAARTLLPATDAPGPRRKRA